VPAPYQLQTTRPYLTNQTYRENAEALDWQVSPKQRRFDDKIRVAVFPARLQTHCNRRYDVRSEVAEWRRPTGRPLNATVAPFGQVLDHRYQADRMTAGLAAKGSSPIAPA
jgi:hypothetical protein